MSVLIGLGRLVDVFEIVLVACRVGFRLCRREECVIGDTRHKRNRLYCCKKSDN